MYENHVPIVGGDNPNEGRVKINGQFEYLYDNMTENSSAITDVILYTNSAQTYVDVGGIEDGSTFSAVTMQDMWTDLLYPNLNPSFHSFIMSGNSSSVDVGYTLVAGSKTWTWNTVNSGFIQPNTVKILDYTNSTTLVSGLSNDGIEVAVTPIDVQKEIKASHRWIIYAQKMNNMWFGRNYYMNWYWRRYWGGSTDPNLNSGVTGLTHGELSNLITGPFEFSAGTGYKYIALPTSSGWIDPAVTNPHGYWSAKDPEIIIDALTNLNIALADASDGYTDNINGLPYKEMSISNIYGYSETYRVFRTKYQLGGAINIIIK